MYVWLFAGIIGAMAGVLIPGAWYFVEELQIEIWNLDSSGSSIAYLLPLAAACIVVLLFQLGRAYRTADAFTYFISDLHYNDGRRDFFVSFIHGVAAFVMLVGGGVIGIEALSFEWLSALGAKFGKIRRLPAIQLKTLSVCGLTSTFAALIGQPAAAFIFAIELLYGWGGMSSTVGPLALSAFIAASVSRTFTSPSGFFHSLSGTDGGLSQLLRGGNFTIAGLDLVTAFVLVTLGATMLAVITIWLLRKTDQEFHNMLLTRRASDVSFKAISFRIVVWALMTGLVFQQFPDALGSGIKLVQGSMWQSIGLASIVLAILVRLLLGALSYSVIGSAGLILPILMLGALMGAAIANLPSLFEAVAVPTMALLGIGAFFAASFGVPVTATALVYGYAGGVAGENATFLFLSIAINFSASYFTGLVQNDRIATMGLYRRGIRFRNGMCFNTLSSITVRDAMLSWVNPIAKKSSLGDAYKLLIESRFLKMPVVDEEKNLTGMISLGDFYALEAWKNLEKNSQVYDLLGIEDVIKPAFQRVQAGMSLEDALNIMGDEDILPVVDEENTRFMGMLLKSDLVNLYNKEVVKKALKR